jgi:carboxymethylenebutenolidase
MSRTIDYYLAPQSPWTYLGHQRMWDLAQQAQAQAHIRVMPVDLGQVFPVSGGLPLGKRAPQRQAYRLMEMTRFSQHLNLPIHLQPKFFPVAGDDAARVIIAVDLHHGTQAAMAITGAILKAVWAQERNIADTQVLAELLAEQHLDAACLAQATQADVQTRYTQYTQSAIDVGVFGAPTYVIEDQMYWGQDRLDFVARHLQA